MAELQPANFTQNGCTTAQQDRLIFSSLVCTEGVADLDGGSLLVSAGAPGLTVDIAAGAAFVEGTEVTDQGMYHVFNDASVSVTATAADPTDPRIDLVVARVYDTEYSGVLDEWHIEIIAGTPSPVPVAPALPDNSISLAEVSIDAGATSLSGGDITDTRESYAICSEQLPAGGLLGIVRFTTDSSFIKGAYPGLRSVKVKCQGGGGGGGAASATGAGNGSAGGGGGGGGYVEGWVSADDLGTSETVTVGAGGAGSASGSGLSGTGGGTSSFGGPIFAATGGAGGTYGAQVTNGVTAGGANGIGVSGAPGYLEVAGGEGDVGRVNAGNPIPARGGDSYLGSGGPQTLATNTGGGSDATGYGAGGSGSFNRESQSTAAAGGDGADGIVIVELYG